MAELETQKVAKRQKLEKRSAAPGAADQDPGAAVDSSGTEVVMQEAANASSFEPPAAEADQPEQVAVAVMVIVVAPSWAKPIRDFLVNGALPQDEVEARKIQR